MTVLVAQSYTFFLWFKCFIILIMTKRIFGSVEKFLNIIVLVVSGAYITHFMLGYSAIPVRLTSSQLTQILFILYVIDIFKVFKAFVKKEIGTLILFVGTFLITLLSYQASGGEYQFLMFIPPIMFALYDVEYDRAVTVYLFLVGIVLLVAIFSSQVNIISNYVYSSYQKIRSSWGICYPTDFATIVLFFCVFLWTKKKRCSDWLMLFPAIISLLIATKIASSRTSTICSVIFIIGIVGYNIFGIIKEKVDLTLFKKVINILFVGVFPLCAILTLVFVLLYQSGTPLADTLNTMMSGRIKLIVDGITNYGIHPFGSYFELKGGGGGGTDFYTGYNFIDNSYALMFIRYGWMYFLMIATLWVVSIRKVLKAENYKVAIVMTIIAFHSLSEHHYIDPSFNLLLVMPFVNFKENKKKVQVNTIAESIGMMITVVVSTVVLYCVLPSLLSYVRTFVTVNNIQNINSKTGAIVIPILMLFAGLLICFIYSLKQLIVSLITNKKISMPFIYALCLALIVVCLVPQYKNMIFSSHYDSYLEIFQNEEEVINLINDNKKGKIYSTDVPEYYARYFKGFSSSLLQGEELAKEKDITVITDLSNDAEGFTYNGFKWMQISDDHAIYTNDEQVINTLVENGYELNDYYAKENTVDVIELGRLNGIIPNDDGHLIIESNHTSITASQYMYVHAGNYSFILNLSGLYSVLGQDIPSDQPIANITFKYSDTDAIAYEGQIYPQFDENGNYDCETQLNSWRVGNVYMTLEPVNDAAFWLNGMSYKKFQ